MIGLIIIFITFILGGILALAALIYLKTYRMAQHADKIPGPKTLPIVGNAFYVGGLFATSQDFFHACFRASGEFGPILRMWIGPEVFIFVSHPKVVETLLSSNKILTKGNNYKFLIPWIGTGLLNSSGDKWRKHRKIITPTFHFKILEEFLELFNVNDNKLIHKLKKHVNGPEFNIYPYITLCALDNICETAMGVSINAQDNENSEFVQSIRNMADIIVKRSFRPWLHSELLFPLFEEGRCQKRSLKIIHDMTDKVIKAKKAERHMHGKDKNSAVGLEDDVGIKKKKAFLDMLLDATEDNNLMSDEELREEVDTFMFEGHDTTASAISFTLACLALHPNVQDKVHDEQLSIFGSSNRDATFHDIQEMKYLEMVIKETLRLFPSVPMFVRNMDEDVEIEGYVFPKGANVTISNFCLHRNEKIYPNPNKFDPERFSSLNSIERDPYVYIPFSAGPRNCVGQKFAMLEVKSVVSKVIRHYKLLPASITNEFEELTSELVLKNSKGFPVKITERKF